MRSEHVTLHFGGEWLCIWQPIGANGVSVCYRFDRERTYLSECLFYQDGVTNGTELTVPANDEFHLTKAWQQLAKQHNVRLETCVAAALRRGVVSQSEAAQHGLLQHNLAEGFEQAGLGSLAEAMLTQDRVVQF